MSLHDLLPLGQPPHDDVDGAARLWNEYQRQGGLSADGERIFWRSVANWQAVMKRAGEIEAPGEGDASLAAALLDELGDDVPADAIRFDANGVRLT